jgi:hypothetical protein
MGLVRHCDDRSLRQRLQKQGQDSALLQAIDHHSQ